MDHKPSDSEILSSARCQSFVSVVCGTVCCVFIVVTIPMIFTYVQKAHARLDYKVSFCKSSVRILFFEANEVKARHNRRHASYQKRAAANVPWTTFGNWQLKTSGDGLEEDRSAERLEVISESGDSNNNIVENREDYWKNRIETKTQEPEQQGRTEIGNREDWWRMHQTSVTYALGIPTGNREEWWKTFSTTAASERPLGIKHGNREDWWTKHGSTVAAPEVAATAPTPAGYYGPSTTTGSAKLAELLPRQSMPPFATFTTTASSKIASTVRTSVSTSSTAPTVAGKVTGFDECCCQQGPPGPPGPSGNSGKDGADGTDGKEGPPGLDTPLDHVDDAPVPSCTTCLAGSHGAPGPSGSKGRPGPKGPDGRPGTTGPKGKPGQTGIPGPPGPPGPVGQKGADGLPGTVHIVEAPPGTLGPPGHPCPPGQPGETGPPGKSGVMGKNGEVGEPGEIGLNGEAGANGAPGKRGKEGSIGKCDHCPPPRTAPGY